VFTRWCEGSKNAKVIDSGHDRCSMYDGSAKFGLDRTDSERLFRQLVILGVLDEELYVTSADHTVCYIRPGLRANDLLNRKFKVPSGVFVQRTLCCNLRLNLTILRLTVSVFMVHTVCS